jgi:DNA-binding NtrC family response regulator
MATQGPVLIVDGNPQMRAMVQRFLARQQVDTQVASSPTEAHTMLVHQALPVLLTDAFLPSGDGLALVRALRQIAPGTRGILMTAFRAPALWQQALADGAYACLAKPFRLQELWDLVQPALQGLPAPAVRRPSGQVERGWQLGGMPDDPL